MKTINTCSLKVIAIKNENIRKMFLAVISSRILYTKGTSRIPAGRVLTTSTGSPMPALPAQSQRKIENKM